MSPLRMMPQSQRPCCRQCLRGHAAPSLPNSIDGSVVRDSDDFAGDGTVAYMR